MEEILHHLGWLKPYKQWDKPSINGCRIFSIHSITHIPPCNLMLYHPPNLAKSRWYKPSPIGSFRPWNQHMVPYPSDPVSCAWKTYSSPGKLSRRSQFTASTSLLVLTILGYDVPSNGSCQEGAKIQRQKYFSPRTLHRFKFS